MHHLRVVHHADVHLEVRVDVEVANQFTIEERVRALGNDTSAWCRAVGDAHERIAAVVGCAREHASQQRVFLREHAEREVAAVADQRADDLTLLKRHHQHGWVHRALLDTANDHAGADLAERGRQQHGGIGNQGEGRVGEGP